MIYIYNGGSDGKASVYNVGDTGLIPGLGRFPGEGNGNPLQCSCLENLRDGGAWWGAVSVVAQSRTQLKQLSSSSSSRVKPIEGCNTMLIYSNVTLSYIL